MHKKAPPKCSGALLIAYLLALALVVFRAALGVVRQPQRLEAGTYKPLFVLVYYLIPSALNPLNAINFSFDQG